MSFVSYEFVFLFIPIFFAGWYCIQKKCGRKRKLISELYLIVISLIFYSWHNTMIIVVFLPVLLFNWIGVYFMQKINMKNSRLYLCVFLLLVNVGIWLLFKYGSISKISLSDNISLLIPIGISFYTIQQIMFLVDSYHDCNLKYNIIDYLAYSTFFPCIISGPIIKHDEFIPQLKKQFGGKSNLFDQTKIQQGIISFSLGMGKKVIIAKQLGFFADYGFSQPESVSSLVTVLSILSYTFQLYFDFSGYCDMAEGIALILGFSLSRNFESPYKAATINEFWKKWHITLTRFLTYYVYIPLGGGMHGMLRRSLNIIIVYLISGFWHGTSITFILWGIIHAFLMIIDKLTEKLKFRNRKKSIGQIITFVLVSLAWVPFRSETMVDTIAVYRNITRGSYIIDDAFWSGMCRNTFSIFKSLWSISSQSFIFIQKVTTILFMLCICIIIFKGKNVRELREQYSNSIAMAVICAIVLWISVMQFTSVETFIYEGF